MSETGPDLDANKALVREYFERLQSGDPTFPDLLADDVAWWVPPGSDMSGTYEGKDAVMAFIGSGVGYYDAASPMHVDIEQVVAEGEWVAVQFVLRATTAAKRPYRNHYHFAFRIRDGRIVLVKEYLDTKIAHDAFHG